MSAAAILTIQRSCLRIPRFFRKALNRMYGWFSLDGRAARKLGEGRSPAFSTNGDAVAWVFNGQIWFQKIKDPSPNLCNCCTPTATVLHSLGHRMATTLPSSATAGSHSFIGVYSFSANTLNYPIPAPIMTDIPCGRRTAARSLFVRIPYAKDEDFTEPRRTGQPWSIRVADAATERDTKSGRLRKAAAASFTRSLAIIRCSGVRTIISFFPGRAMAGRTYIRFSRRVGRPLLTPGNFELECVSSVPIVRPSSTLPTKTISTAATSGRFLLQADADCVDSRHRH